jgi:hypothetical protein
VFFKIGKNLSDNSAPIMSEANAQNHANFAGAFIMTAGAIKIDKRLPCFNGGRAGDIKSDRMRAPRGNGMTPLFNKGNVRHRQRKSCPSSAGGRLPGGGFSEDWNTQTYLIVVPL